jgi:Flp pilus assembly protein TadG
MAHFKQLLDRFLQARGGNISVLMSIGMISLIGVTGIGVDYSRVIAAKSEIFAAADAAALAGARTYGTASERETAARLVFDANVNKLKGIAAVSMTPQNILKEGANYGYKVQASAKIKTMFGSMFGVDEFSADVLAEAIGTISSNTEVALVLDSTYSMTGWKMNTLKQAATQMVEDLTKLRTKPEQLKFSVVSFSEYVNVGIPNRKKSWMDVKDDYKDPDRQVCYDDRPVISQTNCHTVNYPPSPGTLPGTCYNDGVPYSCGGSSPTPGGSYQACDNVYGPTQRVCYMQQGAWHRWNGCVGSRDNPYDTKDSNYGKKIPGLMDMGCGTPLLELTSDSSSVKKAIQALNPNGETYIPAGLIWGWRTLSAQDPFTAGVSTSTSPVRKYLVLMTDGLNTRSPTYPLHNGSDGAKSNALTKQICTNIASDKKSEIQIFSVAFDVRDAATKTMLKDCAKNTGGQFFDATNAAEFLAAFSKIGSTIAELRLSK